MKSILSLLLVLVTGQAMAEHPLIGYDKQMTVDGYVLDYTCQGDAEPVVILEPPSGVGSERAFKNIFEQLESTNKTCIYARLGNGSDNRAEGLNLTGWDYVRELKTLIDLEAKNSPLILVGYSYGSFVTRLYTSSNPDKVKGLLLIDPPHHMWLQTMKQQMSTDDWQKMNDVLSWFKTYRGHNVWDTQFEVADSKLPADLPVMIVSRGLDEIKIKKAGLSEAGFRQFNDIHFMYIKQMAHLTKNTSEVVAKNSRHLILDSEPEVVMQAFKTLVSKIKSP